MLGEFRCACAGLGDLPHGSRSVAEWQSGRGRMAVGAWQCGSRGVSVAVGAWQRGSRGGSVAVEACVAPPRLPRPTATLKAPQCHTDTPKLAQHVASCALALPFVAKKCKQEGLVNRSVIT